MTRACRVSAGLLLFRLLCFAGAGVALAGIPDDCTAARRTASASATIKSRVFKPRATHPSSVPLSRQHERRPQMPDLYLPSHSSHLLLLRYPVWFQFGPAANYSHVFDHRTISRPPLTAL
jgi:hypothetical protein